MRHLFRVALVHLAAVGLDEEFRHGLARGENNTRASGLRHGEIIDFSSCRSFGFNRGTNEKQNSGNRRHWRQRFVSDERAARCDRTQNRYSVWGAIGHAHWREGGRAAGLFFAAPRARPSAFATRIKSSGQHLRVAFAYRALYHLGDRTRTT